MGSDGDERPLNPQRLRRAQPLNQALPATRRWIAQLPPEIRPLSLLDEFPRVANALAHAWPDAPTVAAYLDSLLHDRRGGRRGFPGHVQIELLTLREYLRAATRRREGSSRATPRTATNRGERRAALASTVLVYRLPLIRNKSCLRLTRVRPGEMRTSREPMQAATRFVQRDVSPVHLTELSRTSVSSRSIKPDERIDGALGVESRYQL